jgi:hypothetical protein
MKMKAAAGTLRPYYQELKIRSMDEMSIGISCVFLCKLLKVKSHVPVTDRQLTALAADFGSRGGIFILAGEQFASGPINFFVERLP